jgi:mannose-6-phosphate isomerase-like protein (cupin superfamily)
MLIKDIRNCEEITAGDNSILTELLNPEKEDLKIRYSLAYAKVKAGETTLAHRLKSSEVYYILDGEGEMYINDETEHVTAGQAIYIPPDAIQKIKNIGERDLLFLCIVDPSWNVEIEEIME